MQSSGYRGNALLRPENYSQKWSLEQIKEYIKCKEDVFYFIEKYVKIVSSRGKEKGFVSMIPYDYQVEMITSMRDNRFTIAVQSRQSGKSISFIAFLTHYILFNDYKTVGIVANKGDVARELLGKLQTSYQGLPIWLQQGIVERNKGSFVLENHSRIIAVATSPDALRSYTCNIIVVDEMAIIENWEEFYSAIQPTITSDPDSKIIMTSTPKGLNHFYEFWEGCHLNKNTNGFYGIYVPWYRVPGQDEAWKENELKTMNYNYEKFNQEYGIEFLGSSGTLIAGWRLKTLQKEISVPEAQTEDGLKIYEYPIKPEKEEYDLLEPIVHESYNFSGKRMIKKERIIPGHKYALIADVSRGKDLDYSAFSVIDISKMPYKQVCTFRNNKLNPSDYTQIILKTAQLYNNAVILVEINDIGEQVGTMLIDEYEYEFVLCTESAGRAGKKISWGGEKADKGIRTTNPLKNSGCLLLKMLVEQSKLIINDVDTISEFNTFSKNKLTYKAEPGKHDDMVMTLVLFAWLSDQAYFKEMTDINTMTGLSERSIEQVESNMVPFGYIRNDNEIDDTKPYHQFLTKNTLFSMEPYYFGNQEIKVEILPNF
jgi:hypothetical protein